MDQEAETAPQTEQAHASETADVSLNANLATRQEIEAAAGAAVADVVLGARPFLSLSDVHRALSGAMTEHEARVLLQTISVPVNLNAAELEELLLIPALDEASAQVLVENRPYDDLAHFHATIREQDGASVLDGSDRYVFVPILLNSATDEEILAIPGVGNRMLHEFKEYRPYTDMEQFRREIGKYVDNAELARLERFVTL